MDQTLRLGTKWLCTKAQPTFIAVGHKVLASLHLMHSTQGFASVWTAGVVGREGRRRFHTDQLPQLSEKTSSCTR